MSKQKFSIRQHSELFMVAVFRLLPIDMVSSIGAWLGRRRVQRAIRLKRKWVERLHRNFECLEGLTEHRLREQRIIQHVEHLGRVYSEYAVLHKIALRRFNVEGGERISGIDGPVIYVCIHTGHWELIGEVIRRFGGNVVALYDPIPDKARLKVAMDVRKNFRPENAGTRYVPASPRAARDMMNYLKQGESLSIFIDEEKDGLVWAPALGRKIPLAGNRMLAARLAVKQGLPVIPIHIQRKEGANFEATIEPPILPDGRLDKKLAAAELAKQLNDISERWVKEDISHWYWLAQLNLDKPFPKKRS
ncbi:hypothetical protein Q4508_15495 [Amphritea sp. 2_MG-2023]|uniref:lysophospholipid acyltransferase family protein n=1 Tax=Amphritea TaxID=515417 RepID=UPI001C07AF29|nr:MULTISPECIES: hypothetical protein [Amphritea]MBU2964874.1 hypothetical protein [Amphritea atlantica]MDO6419963.1 hypothetical protein [Amphritea sp. 2_MG-2023]